MSDSNRFTRRDFVKAAGSAVAAASLLSVTPSLARTAAARRRYAIVGTGDRATGMWGQPLVQKYSDVLEFVGLCDINPKRVVVAKELIGVDCPTFTNFDDARKASGFTNAQAFHRRFA